MQLINYLTRKIPFLAILGLLFGLSSCGSYQYVGVDNDGIYGSSYPNTDYQEDVVVDNQDNSKSNNYYQNYFREKSLEYDNVTNGDVFTDIDSYESNAVVNDSIDNNYQGYAGWGQSNSSVSINVYPSYGYYNYWWNRPYYDYWGYGWNSWAYYDNFWYRPYYYGSYYNSWAYYNPYRYYYGTPYYYSGYYGYYGNHLYNRRGVSYSATRRGSLPSSYSASRNRSSYVNSSAYNTSRRSANTSRTVNRYTSNDPRVYSNTQRRTSSASTPIRRSSRVSTPASNSTSRSSSVRRSYNASSSNNNSYNTRRSSTTTYSPPRYNSSSRSSSSSPSYSRSSSGSSSSGSRSSSSTGRRGR